MANEWRRQCDLYYECINGKSAAILCVDGEVFDISRRNKGGEDEINIDAVMMVANERCGSAISTTSASTVILPQEQCTLPYNIDCGDWQFVPTTYLPPPFSRRSSVRCPTTSTAATGSSCRSRGKRMREKIDGRIDNNIEASA